MIPLSICIPTFERPRLLERALRSVISGSQDTAAELEILVSDDSRDAESAVLCERIFAGWPGTARHVANRPPLGMVANFNQCLASADGRYILILHDDDYLLPGGLSSILAAASRPDQHPVLLFGVQVVDDSGRTRRRQSFARPYLMAADEALHNVLSNSSFVRFPGVVAASDAYRAVGPFDVSLGGATDLDMWIRLFARYGVLCLHETTSAYSVHSDAHTTGMFHAGTVATLAGIFDRVIREGMLPEALVRRYEADFFAQFILGGVYRQLRVGAPNQARGVLALKQLPAIRALGRSRRWWPAYIAMSGLTYAPGPVVSQTTRWLERILMDVPILWPR